MTPQPRGRQSRIVRDSACRGTSAAESPDALTDGLRTAAPTTDPGDLVPDACLASVPAPRDEAEALSGNEGGTESAYGVRPVCIGTSRGRFAALTAEPLTPSSRSVVLLVAGFSGSKEDYVRLLPILAANGFRAVAYDRRGNFETAPMCGREDDDLRLDAHAADVLAVINALGCGPVHLVGHSLGGFIARAAALADPSSIATLTLLSTGPNRVGEPHAGELRLLRAAVSVMSLPEVYEAVQAYRAQQPQGWRQPVVDAAQKEFLRRRFTANDPRALLEEIQVLLSAEDRCAELHELGLPILVAYGGREPYWKAPVQQHMAARLGAHVAEIPHAGHCAQLDDPRRTAAALLAFLTAADGVARPAPPGGPGGTRGAAVAPRPLDCLPGTAGHSSVAGSCASWPVGTRAGDPQHAVCPTRTHVKEEPCLLSTSGDRSPKRSRSCTPAMPAGTRPGRSSTY